MSLKRDVLACFKRDELLAAVDRFELEVKDRRANRGLVNALAGSRRAALAEILADLSRDRLKEICRDLGLDDSGREKAVLVARLTGEASASAPPPVAEAAPSSIDRAPTPRAGRAAAEVTPAGVLTREALERYLWSAADIEEESGMVWRVCGDPGYNRLTPLRVGSPPMRRVDLGSCPVRHNSSLGLPQECSAVSIWTCPRPFSLGPVAKLSYPPICWYS